MESAALPGNPGEIVNPRIVRRFWPESEWIHATEAKSTVIPCCNCPQLHPRKSLFAIRRHGSDSVLGTTGTLFLRGGEAWPGVIEDPETIVVGQIDQPAAGTLKTVGYAVQSFK